MIIVMLDSSAARSALLRKPNSSQEKRHINEYWTLDIKGIRWQLKWLENSMINVCKHYKYYLHLYGFCELYLFRAKEEVGTFSLCQRLTSFCLHLLHPKEVLLRSLMVISEYQTRWQIWIITQIKCHFLLCCDHK